MTSVATACLILNRILNSLQLAFLVHGYYLDGVTNFGNFVADLRASPWSLLFQTVFGSIMLGEFTSVILTLSELCKQVSIVYCSGAYRFDSSWNCFQYPNYEGKFSIPFPVSGLSLEVVSDLIITLSMVHYLVVPVRGSTVKRSATSLTAILVFYCIHSGLITLIFAIICLATYVCYPRSLVYAPFFSILARLYSCSFLAILNSRDNLRTVFRSDTGFATFSISLTTPTPHPVVNTTNVAHGIGSSNRFLKEADTLQFAKYGGLSHGTLDSVTDRHEDKPNPPTGDHGVLGLIPLSSPRSSGSKTKTDLGSDIPYWSKRFGFAYATRSIWNTVTILSAVFQRTFSDRSRA
ncbi:hypothetical protein BGW80DRAFT_1449369, partial [Lactifluus volemus]